MTRTQQRTRRLLALPLAVALLNGCAATPPSAPPPAVETLAGCRAWLDHAGEIIAGEGVRDVQAVPVPGAPHLRVDRLLVTLAAEASDDPARSVWLAHAAALAQAGWSAELANLSDPARERLATRDSARPGRVAAQCIERLSAADAADPELAVRRLETAAVPDAYVGWQRVVGLYPLTRWPVMAGYNRWRDEIDALYRLPLDALPREGELKRYASSVGGSPATGGWPHDALGVPRIDTPQRAALFAAHAPVWEVDTVGNDDRPGTPAWPDGGWRAEVDTARPVQFEHLSFTRVAGEVLPQLNYIAWFPARTPRRDGDIYAGHLDGVILRVTLDRDGAPLLYDTIHACGCYHMFFPTDALAPRPDGELDGEGFHVPQPAPRLAPGERLAVRLQAATHLVLRLHTVPADEARAAIPLTRRPYDDLRSLPRGTGRRSLFGPDGLVAGSERTERFLLWPMGVPSAGAMRQWGHHATAFVGRRHFDDPGLVEAGFEVVSSPLRAGR